ncbi:phosphopantetheine-binding protein [Acinetobacter indicus]|uniref:phosphopantetheine-binding protein n=1 Tax=Acinetobacter TaxID=469 RepID=UPI001443D6AA|nr:MULTISPECIES: phosphopantetheine-binding protein [Acinetobacter]MCP0916035.1 phosphopantetheine-binding protein [Acinetobacter indicus]MCP0919161.1 phosphopantetheine-binding protein [Acinetobacter indicus]MCP0921827.1 phosphopantetheine-binding protein [Acinetobacter indicus]QSQ93820.1 acyl carrier protein [Acinetobacter indicus]
MLYLMPKKIQLVPSQAKWQLASNESVLVLVGLQNLRMMVGIQDSDLMTHLIQISNKAKALDIPIVDLYGDDVLQGMQQLGEYASTHPQLIFAGQVTPMLKQILPHLYSVTEQLCVVDDAILLVNQEQHIQWIENISAQGIHHLNTYSLTRLWDLSAPSEYVLSTKGIMLAVAEQLDMDALEIDPYVDLKNYGLDSVAMVSLVGLWRANGANIRYEDLQSKPTLHGLLQILTD